MKPDLEEYRKMCGIVDGSTTPGFGGGRTSTRSLEEARADVEPLEIAGLTEGDRRKFHQLAGLTAGHGPDHAGGPAFFLNESTEEVSEEDEVLLQTRAIEAFQHLDDADLLEFLEAAEEGGLSEDEFFQLCEEHTLQEVVGKLWRYGKALATGGFTRHWRRGEAEHQKRVEKDKAAGQKAKEAALQAKAQRITAKKGMLKAKEDVKKAKSGLKVYKLRQKVKSGQKGRLTTMAKAAKALAGKPTVPQPAAAGGVAASAAKEKMTDPKSTAKPKPKPRAKPRAKPAKAKAEAAESYAAKRALFEHKE
jgi:hypothetical protein